MKTLDHSKYPAPHILRPDNFVRQDILWTLTQNGIIDGRYIEVSVTNGIVSLEGYVALKSEKKKIENLLESIEGIVNLENKLKVMRVSRYTDGHSMHGF